MTQTGKQYPPLEGIRDPYLLALAHESSELEHAVELLDRELTPIWEAVEDGKTPEQAAAEHQKDILRARALLVLARQCLDATEKLITF